MQSAAIYVQSSCNLSYLTDVISVWFLTVVAGRSCQQHLSHYIVRWFAVACLAVSVDWD